MKVAQRLKQSRELGILLILVVVSIVITLVAPAFFSIENLFDILKSNVVLAIMAIGMLPVILTGGIDVSVSSMVAAVTIIVGKFLMNVSGNIFLAFLVGCLSGTIMGLINGLLVAKLKIPPIVATLGTMSIILGVSLYYTNGNWITGLPKNFIDFGRITIGSFYRQGEEMIGFPIQLLFLILVAVLTWFILRHTLVGRGIYAVGGNRVSAERVGYNVDRITIFLYAYEGFIVGLAGVVHTSIMRQVDPNAFNGFEMQVISAVVLGGASSLGGYGSVSGTLVGVALFSVINNGLILMHIPTFWQKIVVGIVLIASIGFDVTQKRYRESHNTKVDIEEA
ncbi:MAG: ABC transporter permease [Spirochaetaceae bacterium]|nr:ABC transporter permease [Spirochaetaceae bacterium]